MATNRFGSVVRVLVGLLPLVVASRVDAFSGGITTLSFNQSTGCNACHTGGITPTVTLSGPTLVAPSSINDYTLTITANGSQTLGGLNVSSALGVLGLGGADSANTQTLNGTGGRAEITHTAAKLASGGLVTFTFQWTAPASFNSATLLGWGNNVNGNSSTTGDRASNASLTILNANGTATPTPGMSTPTPSPTATQSPGLANPIRRPIRQGPIEVSLDTVASGFTSPLWGTSAPGVAAKYLFVVDQVGTLWRVDVTTGASSLFLDVTSRLVSVGVFGPGTYDERGFLGVAFDPNYATNGLIYTFTSEPATPNPDFSTMPPGDPPDCQSVITEWHVPNPTADDAVVDTNSARVLLRIDKPQFNHNGGALNFGADGMLYLSTGDGGGADDQDAQPFIGGPTVGHGPNGNGQNVGVALGKILRIDPHGSNSANGQYGIPADNPFVGTAGAVGEIWAYGFRNPFRFSFDSLTHGLYVGDVGQNSVEEVDVVTKGGNYGWRVKEGSFFFNFNGADAGYVTKTSAGAIPPGLIEPIAEYDHDEGISVIGGFVYRGTTIPRLVGRYVFAEFAKTFNNDARLFYLRKANLVKPGHTARKSRIAEFKLVGQPSVGISILGLGQDAAGEVYILGNTGGVPGGTSGVVQRISPP